MEKKKAHGGIRLGSGRPSYLKDPQRRIMILEPRHIRYLDSYAKKHKLMGKRSGAIRHIIDGLMKRKTP